LWGYFPYLEFTLRILGTPTEENWKGLSELPDYKTTFPKWKDNKLTGSIKNIDSLGIDILQVCNIFLPALLRSLR
jgi:hypothetical protein